MAAGYLLLLNDTLKRHILSLGQPERRRLREKFEFLANGLWDAGVRVKKLKGAARKVVLEARLSRAERILFTLGRYQDRIAIYVWGIAAHDEVDRRARTILPENAPFLRFEPETVQEYPELSVDEAGPELFTQESVEEKAGEEYGPQRWLVLTDAEWRRLVAGAEPDSLEIHLFLTGEQRQVLEQDLPLLLSGTAGSGKTTILVYTLLRPEFLGKRRLFLTCSPLLKEFSERIYRGLVRNTELEGAAAGAGESADRFAEGAAAGAAEFAVFRNLVESILAAHGIRFDPAREVRLEEFEEIFSHHRYFRRFDPELVWEEIRSIVKGAKPPLSARECRRLAAGYLEGNAGPAEIDRLQEYLLELKPFEWLGRIERLLERRTGFATYDRFVQSLPRAEGEARRQALFLLKEILETLEKKSAGFAAPLLTLEEYIRLGKKRAPNFLYSREEIYEVAGYYQERLEAGGLWDEIDLCRRALPLLEERDGRFAYDLVVCDEVQDFADIQLSLALRLARHLRHVALAGDVKQIINPSGFRWEEAKQKFFERGLPAPEVRALSLNFRCVGGVVRLANALLALKQKLVGLAAGELREDWKFQGKPPFLVEGLAEEEMLRRSRLTGAGRVVLVRDAAEQGRLKKLLGSELVFTVREAKGLEFDAVLLWKFCRERRSAEIWRRIQREQTLPAEHAPHVRHEISLLYVAVTRARNILLVYGGPAREDVWDVDLLREHLQRTSDPELLASLWERVSAPWEWLEQGHYFFQRGYYAAAAECYRNAGDTEREAIAAAFEARRRGRHEEAAGLFDRAGLDREAAESYESSRRYGEAARCWKKAGEAERSRICRIRQLEQEGRHSQAAREWEKLGNLEEAARNWELANDHARLGDWLYSRRQYGQAGARYEQAGDWLRAADSWLRAREPDRAAGLYLKARRPELAVPLYRKARNTEKLLACYEALGEHYEAALLYEKRKETEKAVEHFRRFAGQSPGNRARLREEAQGYERGRGALKAAARYSALSLFDRSAPVFRDRKLYSLAHADYLAAGRRLEAAECLSLSGRHLEAVEELEKLDLPDREERAVRELALHLREGGWARYQERARELALEGQKMLARGEAERALLRFQAVHDEEGVFEAYLKLRRDEEAVLWFLAQGRGERVEEYLQARGPDLRVTPGLLERLIEDRERRGGWFLSGVEEPGWIEELAARLLASDREAAVALLRRAFDSLKGVFLYRGDIAEETLRLMLEARHAGALCRVAAAYRDHAREVPERIAGFFRRVRAAAVSEGNRALQAAATLLDDPPEFERLLEGIPLSRETLELFTVSATRYPEAVDYLLAQPGRAVDTVEQAAWICRRHRDRPRAAAVYEAAGNLKAAGREYREAQLYEEAARCFRLAGDQAGVARVREASGDYAGAVEIWKQLGRKRDVERVERKKRRAAAQRRQAEEDRSQGELFGPGEPGDRPPFSG